MPNRDKVFGVNNLLQTNFENLSAVGTLLGKNRILSFVLLKKAGQKKIPLFPRLLLIADRENFHQDLRDSLKDRFA